MQVSEFDITCPRWALPREEIPIHVKIDKDVTHKIDCVRISLDERLRLADTINISKYEGDQTITIKEIEKSARSDYDYFGIVVATKTPPDDLKAQISVPIEVAYRDGTTDRHVAHARIFRPRVEFANMPENVVLSDDEDGLVIPVGLKFFGFGEVSLRVECAIGGEIISEGSSSIDETLRRIVGGGLISEDKGQTVSIDGEYVERMVAGLKKFDGDRIQRMIREQRMDDDMRDDLCQLIKDDGQRAADIFYRTAGAYMSQIVPEILGRHLGANSHLESHTRIRYLRQAPLPGADNDSKEPRNPRTQTHLPHTDVQVRFFYKDNMGNEYDPIEQTVSIIDKRAEPAMDEVSIPIRVNVDESSAYENVKDMSVGS